MSTDVNEYEVLWDAENVYLSFVDEKGDGEALTFSHEQFENVVDAMNIVRMEIYNQSK